MSNSESTQREKEIVIMYWKENKDNSIKEIAERFQLSEYVVHNIINKYLDGLKPRV